MVMLDTFNSDHYGVVSLTEALEMIPYQPNWLGSMPGLFKNSGITTTTAVIEERHGLLSLVPTSARGTTVTTEVRKNRKVLAFPVPHIALTSGLLADDVQNVRAFGTEDVTETVAGKVNEITTQLRDDIEITKEFHRHGAIQGIVYDADLTTVIYNFFTAFGVAEQTEEFDFFETTANIKQSVTNVIRKMHIALGGVMFTGIVGLCGDQFFDELVSHPTIRLDFDRWRDGHLFRTQQIGGAGYFTGPDGQDGFVYGGVTFFNSRAAIGEEKFIPTDVCRFFPLGVPNLFKEVNAPADYIETVNTVGRPYYVKQERMKWDKGIEFEVQSNSLIMPTRPKVLIKGTMTQS
jgi:hypothetical protein